MNDSKDLSKTDHGEKNNEESSNPENDTEKSPSLPTRAPSTTLHVVGESTAKNNESNETPPTTTLKPYSTSNKPPPIAASTEQEDSSSAAAGTAVIQKVVNSEKKTDMEPPTTATAKPVLALPPANNNDAPGIDRRVTIDNKPSTDVPPSVAKEKMADAKKTATAAVVVASTVPTSTTTATTIAQVSVQPAPPPTTTSTTTPFVATATATSTTAATAAIAPSAQAAAISKVAAAAAQSTSSSYSPPPTAAATVETAKGAAASTIILKATPPPPVVVASVVGGISTATATATTTTMAAAAATTTTATTTITTAYRDRSGSESTSALPVDAAAAASAAALMQQQPMTVEDAEQEAFRISRTPLTSLYDPYLCPTDTCLADARKRLETAIQQTYKLRQDFTERVYGKYKVCLKPPQTVAATLAMIRKDPVGELQRRTEEIERIRIEKEMEKRDSTKLLLNTELTTRAATAELNIDHAEQLMYLSSGLSLIILPEDDNVDAAILKRYNSGRGPVDLETGQRHRSLSNAAATSGEVMLNRRRKADALRNERLRRKQLYQHNRSGGGGSVMTTTDNAALVTTATTTAAPSSVAIASRGSSSVTALSVIAGVLPPLELVVAATAAPPLSVPPIPATATAAVPPPQKKPPTKKKQSSNNSASGSKSGKGGRAASALSTNALLSLSPLADQMDSPAGGTAAAAGAAAVSSNSKIQIHVLAPATAALIAKGVGESLASASKSTQIRLKHPHPESMGGKRRASSLSGGGGGGNSSTAAPIVSAAAAQAALKQQPQQGAAFQQEFLKQSLPPLPSTKDRLERKPVAVYTPQEATTRRVRQSLRAVLGPFHKTTNTGAEPSPPNQQQQQLFGSMTKIELLRNLCKLGNTTSFEDQKADSQALFKEEEEEEEEEEDPVADSSTLDPMLTFMVLNAVGLIGQVRASPQEIKKEDLVAQSDGFTKRFSNIPPDSCTDKLNSLRKKVLMMSSSSTATSTIFSAQDEKKRTRRRSIEESPRQSKRLRMLEPTCVATTGVVPVEVVSPLVNANQQRDNDNNAIGVVSQQDLFRKNEEAPPVESIRGGGEALEEMRAPGYGKSDAVMSDTITTSLPAERIRGGGEIDGSKDDSDCSQPIAEASRKDTSAEPGNNSSNEVPSGQSEAVASRNGRKRSGSLPAQPGAAAAVARTSTESAPMSAYDYMALAQSMPATHAAGYMTSQERFPHAHNINSFHLAQQLGQGAAFHHPAAGDIAGNVAYLALHQRGHDGFDFSSFVPGATGAGQSAMAAAAAQSSLAALGLARQNQAVAEARAAMYARGAAGFPQGAAPFGHVGGHPSGAVAAFLGPDPSALLGHGQYGGPMAAMYHQQLTGAPVDTTSSSGRETKDTERKPAPHQRLNEKNADVKQKTAPVAQSSEKSSSKQKGSHVVQRAAVPESDGKQAARSSTKPKPGNGEPRNASAANPNPDDSTQPAVNEAAMKFFKPGAPSAVSEEDASLIRAGKFHEVVARLTDTSKKNAALEYLVSVGGAVPIPKALVLVPLKERVNTPGFKISGSNGSPAFPRDVVVSTIMVWLWASNEHSFQSAFEKSGRIDVDPDCKWLVQAAVETSFRELTSEIANERATNKGPFVEYIARKTQSTVTKHDSGVQAGEDDRSSASKKLEIHTAAIVSKALLTELTVDSENNSAIPLFQSLVDYLDEARLCALRAKSRERTLLATLISRRTMMSEAFSNAYVSAMVRAGEALGHGKLFECVQNEDVGSTTMIPYDVFTDDSNEWEDPCKPEGGFEAGCSAVELSRKAHARAMIQKSLKKLQDRFNIRGGTASSGPYADLGADGSSGASRNTPSISPRVGLKRKFSSLSEPPVPPGTGSASAKNWTQYDPRHFSAPLEWSPEHVENTPYGRHHSFERPRSLSLSLTARTGEPKSGKKVRRSSSMTPPDFQAVVDKNIHGNLPRGTRAIQWGEVAGIFQRVELPKKSPPSKAFNGHHGSAPVRAGETIFAPFCRKFVDPTSEDESDTEEDLSETTVLANHQAVLDEMKHKLHEFLEARRKQQERRKTR